MTQKQPNPPSQLKELQAQFSDAIFSSSKSTANVHEAAALIKETQSLKPEDRLKIYVDDYWNRCMSSLSDDFSILKNHMGENAFTALIEAYLHQFKSTEFTLYYLGRHLQTFIANSYTGDDKNIILEIARYEWTQMEVTFGKTVAALDPQSVSDPNRLLTSVLRFQDHVFLLTLRHPHWYDDECDAPLHLILYKDGLQGREMTLDPLEYRLFSLIYSGMSISDSVEEICEDDETIVSPDQIQAWFQRAIQLKWLVEL